jgi:uncharacterized protein
MKNKGLYRRDLMKTAFAAGTASVLSSCSSESEFSREGERKSRGSRLPVPAEDIYDELMEYTGGLEIIDTHEHLVSEPQRLSMEVDVLLLLSQYSYVDLQSAGLEFPGGESFFTYNYPQMTEIPLEVRWKKMWPYIKRIKLGCYYRPTKIALRDLYGIDDLNEDTYRLASERIKARNTEGLYRRILRERCNIKTVLNQSGVVKGQQPADILKSVYTGTNDAYSLWNKSNLEGMEQRYEVEVKDLDTYLVFVEKDMAWAREHGAYGCKIFISPPAPADKKAASADFKDFLAGNPATPKLKASVLDFILKTAEKWDWPVAVHTGVWDDFRNVDPKHAIDLVQRYPQNRFDIYHLGMPYVRDCIFISKNFKNAYLNLCWTYIVSQDIAEQAINEIIDLVPMNKVFGFGGDYIWSVENSYGHYVMARETLSAALTARIIKQRIDLDEAKLLLKSWLFDNPVDFYKIS